MAAVVIKAQKSSNSLFSYCCCLGAPLDRANVGEKYHLWENFPPWWAAIIKTIMMPSQQCGTRREGSWGTRKWTRAMLAGISWFGVLFYPKISVKPWGLRTDLISLMCDKLFFPASRFDSLPWEISFTCPTGDLRFMSDDWKSPSEPRDN